MTTYSYRRKKGRVIVRQDRRAPRGEKPPIHLSKDEERMATKAIWAVGVGFIVAALFVYGIGF